MARLSLERRRSVGVRRVSCCGLRDGDRAPSLQPLLNDIIAGLECDEQAPRRGAARYPVRVVLKISARSHARRCFARRKKQQARPPRFRIGAREDFPRGIIDRVTRMSLSPLQSESSREQDRYCCLVVRSRRCGLLDARATATTAQRLSRIKSNTAVLSRLPCRALALMPCP